MIDTAGLPGSAEYMQIQVLHYLVHTVRQNIFLYINVSVNGLKCVESTLNNFVGKDRFTFFLVCLNTHMPVCILKRVFVC